MIARAIAATAERTRGPGAVEGGLGWFAALVFPLWMIVGLAFGAFAVNADQKGPHHNSLLTDALMMAAIGAPILGVILFFFYRPYQPRQLHGPARWIGSCPVLRWGDPPNAMNTIWRPTSPPVSRLWCRGTQRRNIPHFAKI